MAVARRFPSAPVQISPGIAHPPSRSCLSDLRHGVPYKFRASTIMAVLPRRAASYPLPVRQASASLSTSSRFPVTQNTLAVQLTLPLVGRVENFHLQVSAPCRAHHEKTAPWARFFIETRSLTAPWHAPPDIRQRRQWMPSSRPCPCSSRPGRLRHALR